MLGIRLEAVGDGVAIAARSGGMVMVIGVVGMLVMVLIGVKL